MSPAAITFRYRARAVGGRRCGRTAGGDGRAAGRAGGRVRLPGSAGHGRRRAAGASSLSRAGGCACRWAAGIGASSGIASLWARRPIGSRQLKSVAAVVDRQPLLSPAMLRLTRWMADYYLVPVGAGAGGGRAGGRAPRGRHARRATAACQRPKPPARIGELKLPAKQADVLRTLAASARPLIAEGARRARRLHASRRSTSCARRGWLSKRSSD